MLGCIIPIGSAVLGVYDFLAKWGRAIAIATSVVMAARYVWRPR